MLLRIDRESLKCKIIFSYQGYALNKIISLKNSWVIFGFF